MGECFSWYWLTRVVPDKSESHKMVVCMCVCVCVCVCTLSLHVSILELLRLLLISECKLVNGDCVTERMHNLGLGITHRTSSNAKGSSLHNVFWWLSRERT